MENRMAINDARDLVDKVVQEFFSIGERAAKEEFQKAYAKMKELKSLWQFMTPSQYGCFVNNTVYFTHKYDGASQALEILKTLYIDYEKVCQYDYANMTSIHEQWARLYVELNDEKLAYEHLKQAAFCQFIDNVSYDNFEYFSFRSFTQYALADIAGNTLSLSHPSMFNDPMDTILLRWNQYMLNQAKTDTEKIFRTLYQKVFDHLKVRCFVRTDELPRNIPIGTEISVNKAQHIEEVNPLMWVHYASNHTGFCVKYRLPSKIVRNENKSTLVNTRIGNVNYQPSMKFADKFSVFDALYAKHKIWAYENEVRLVEYDPNNNDNFKTIKIDEDCIQSIYLGLRCSDENREKMKLLLRSRNVKLYQMEVDAIDCYKLVKRRLM